MDGIGDTIRVSLTEDSIYEIPVARALAEKTQLAWSSAKSVATPLNDCLDPFKFQRRESQVVTLGPKVQAGGNQFPRVLTPAPLDPKFTPPTLPDTPCEGLLFKIVSAEQIRQVPQLADIPNVLDLGSTVSLAALEAEAPLLRPGDMLTRTFAEDEAALLTDFARFVRSRKLLLALDLQPNTVAALGPILQALGSANMVVTLADYRAKQATVSPCTHALGSYRGLVEAYRLIGFKAPLWIRSTTANSLQPSTDPLGVLLEGSVLLGGLLCDGLGDLVSVETESSPERSQKLAYNILQGAGSRITKTEYVACPSCGRTLFDLQSTTQRIRSMTGHLKGVKIAIMGCIVNGPGEMADADFGYVGGAPGKINLYVGKDCVQFNIPQAEADARLIALIRKHGKWLEPVQPTASA
jgi:(E)-4-hydroxy-3-methylbut-2-enyl-diphosphate synthase